MTQIFEEFQEFRKILCICPCCGDLVRVSDLKLRVKGTITKTWLDEYKKKEQEFAKKEEKFDEQEEKLRETARKKGRKEAEKVFNKAILPSFKLLKLDPLDIKPILHPVDFIVFKGMHNKDTISDIVFLSKKYHISTLNTIREQIQNVISKKSYEWQVARIDDNGKITFE